MASSELGTGHCDSLVPGRADFRVGWVVPGAVPAFVVSANPFLGFDLTEGLSEVEALSAGGIVHVGRVSGG